MIALYLGNLGSGKTLSCVRDLKINDREIVTFSNIKTKGIPNNITLKTENILKKELIRTKKDGTEVYKYKLNVEFWKKVRKKYDCLGVILDESHRLFSSRRSMSQLNLALADFLHLLRRIVGEADGQKGSLIMITQIPDAVDKRCRQLCTLIKYHVMYITKKCPQCQYVFYEHNEVVIKNYRCPLCKHKGLTNIDYTCYVWVFANITDFDLWYYNKFQTYVDCYRIKHCQNWFNLYNSEQWDDLVSNY